MLTSRLDDELLRSLVEAAPDALVLTNAEGHIVFVNARTEALFGYPRAELYGQLVEVLIPAAQRAPHAEKRAAFTATPHTRPMGLGLDLTGRRRDGTQLPVEVSLSPVQTADGVLIVAAVRDISARIQARKALRDAEDLFRLTFENAPIGMAIVSPDGFFSRVNRSLCQVLGYSREELTTLTFLAITHPDDRELHLSMAGQLDRSEIQLYQIPKRYVRKDGQVVDAMLSVSTVRGPDGTPLHNVAQIEDITERKRAEEALRRSEDHLARAQRVAHIGSWDWNLRTNQVSRSAELYEIHGIKPDPKYNQALSILHGVHQDDRERVEAAVNDAAHAGCSFQIEFRNFHADGSERVLLSQGEPVLQEGQPIRMVGTVMDITERKHLERGREESLRWLHTVLDQCPVSMVLLHGAHGERVEFNKHLQSLIGGTDDGIYKNTDLAFLDEHGHLLVDDQHPSTRALRGERIDGLALSLKTLRGEVIPILLDAVPLMDQAGAVQGAVIVFQNITVFKQLDRLRSEWNSVIAHDLRQPVMTITLIAQLLARKKQGPTELAKLAELIITSSCQLNRMIGDLLDLSRLEARQLTLDCRPVSLPELVGTSVERIALEAPDRRFAVRIVNEIPVLNLDAERITQVTENLLSNAVKYGDPETPITIDVESVGEKVTVAITNTGTGIAPEELPHLFQRFRRTEHARRGPIKGIGLGLYIVQQLVAAHGGQVEATSIPGGPTTFRYSLPKNTY